MDDHFLRICLVKTLLNKTLWEKILAKEKEYIELISIVHGTYILKSTHTSVVNHPLKIRS